MKKNLVLLAALALALIVLSACQQSSTAKTDAAVSGTATPTGSASDTWRADSGQAGKVGSGMGQAGGLAGILDLPGTNAAPGQQGPTGSASTGGTTLPNWSQPGAGSASATEPPPAVVTPSGNYSDIVAVLDRMTGMMDRFQRSVQGASSARDVARAMNLLADGMESMKGDIQAVARRHPELGKLKEPPNEIKPAFFRLMKAAGAMQSPDMAKKLQQYAQDSEVQQAVLRMMQAGQAFQELGKSMK